MVDLPRVKQKNRERKAGRTLATNLKTMEVSYGAILFVCYTHHEQHAPKLSPLCSTELSDLIASEKEENDDDDDDDDEIRSRSKRMKCD